MASGTIAASRFRGGGGSADRRTINIETAGNPAAGVDGSIFAPGVLRPPAVLFRGPHAYGECIHAKRLAAIRAYNCNFCGNAGDGKDFLEERGEARPSAKDLHLFEEWNRTQLAPTEPPRVARNRANAFTRKRSTGACSRCNTTDGYSRLM